MNLWNEVLGEDAIKLLLGKDAMVMPARMFVQGLSNDFHNSGKPASSFIGFAMDTPQVDQGTAELWAGTLVFLPMAKFHDPAHHFRGYGLEGAATDGGLWLANPVWQQTFSIK